MSKRRLIEDVRYIYRRRAGQTIFARDEHGRYNCYTIQGGNVRRLASGMFTLPPIYGRVNFANNVRFVAHTRSQYALSVRYAAIPAGQKITTGWVALPQNRAANRRQTNQGMNTAMNALTGGAISASNYALWFSGRNPHTVDATVPWEWCHLLAHSMGGADNATNIVAAVKGNNSEQLAIESALSMYRMENVFELKVTGATIDNADGQHLGDVIRYKIRCTQGGESFVRYLDCLNAPNPSEIHYYDLLRSVALWANRLLVRISGAQNPTTKTEYRLIQQYIATNG